MTTTLVLPEALASELHATVRLEVESAAVILSRFVALPGGDVRLLATAILPVPDDGYAVRTNRELSVTSGGYVPALARAEAEGATPIWFHTHPGDGASPEPSRRDRRVDQQLADLFRLRADSDFYGSLVMAPGRNGQIRFSGRLDDGSTSLLIDRLLTVGERMSLVHRHRVDAQNLSPSFDRNIRAFGGDVQKVLSDLRVGVVGCGGTGSAVAEQLVRLGVRHLLLIDPDRLSVSNVTRVYGSGASDVGKPKVNVVARHLQSIAADLKVDIVASSINVEKVARRLSSVDVVFGCTDDNAGRLVLSRVPTYFLVPVIDCGVLLSDRNGRLEGIYGRVTVVYPGSACLVCRDRIDLARARTEMLTPEERHRLIDEGYAPALPGVEPAVVAYTTLVASYAVGELLERLIGYGPEPRPSEILLRIHDREISTNHMEPRERHYCDPAMELTGRGLTSPLLEQTWAA